MNMEFKYEDILEIIKIRYPDKRVSWIVRKSSAIFSSSKFKRIFNRNGSLNSSIDEYLLECSKHSLSLENCIKRHGPEKGLKVFNDTIEKQRKSNKGKSKKCNHPNLDNLISIYGEEIGRLMYEDLTSRGKEKFSLRWFISRYGEELGSRLYKERSEKIKNCMSLNGFIDRYGEVKGVKLFNDHIEKSKNTLDNFISRHGDILGRQKWNEYLIKLSNRKNEKVSKVSIELFDSVKSTLINLGYKEDDIFYGNGEKSFIIDILGSGKKSIVKPDFYLKSKKLAVEFYGDYWHKNPEFLAEDDNGESYSKLWDWDRNRIRSMYHSEFIEAVEIVWESEYNSNKEETVNKLIKFLTEYEQEN